MHRGLLRSSGRVLWRGQSMARNSSTASAATKIAGERPIYLDMQSTTPIDPRVSDSMLPHMGTYYGNPHSRTHAYGWEAEKSIERAREEIADLIGAQSKEIVFTSGATEANNMAVKGVSLFYKSKKNHIITTQIEHKCVLDSCRWLQQRGFEVTYLPVNCEGIIDLEELKGAIRPGETSLISVMAVNNEIGVLQPMKEIGDIAKEHGVFFHTDAAQMVGKLPVDVNEMGIDLMSISGHKLYGPKGIGCLYLRRRPRVRLEPLFSGGGQERGLRSGTLPTSLIVGFGAAARIAAEEMTYDHMHVEKLSQHLYSSVMKRIPEVVLNGPGNLTQRFCGNLNMSFAYVEGESLLMALKDIAVSSGSACTSASLEPSYVLRALGVDDDMAHTSLRFGIGRFSTQNEVDFTVDTLVKAVDKLRDMSPLWEMKQEGIDIKSINWTQEH